MLQAMSCKGIARELAVVGRKQKQVRTCEARCRLSLLRRALDAAKGRCKAAQVCLGRRMKHASEPCTIPDMCLLSTTL